MYFAIGVCSFPTDAPVHVYSWLFPGDSVALLVNNLGGTSILELHIVAKEAIHWIGESE